MVAGAKLQPGGILMVGTNKALGQHWLKNRAILDEIADLTASEGDGNLCLEIGPGLGFLTSSLLKRFKKVIAVEYDERLATNLPNSFPGKNLEVVHGDILRYDFSCIKEPYAVAGNIPYYITSPIIEKLLKAENPPKRIVLLVQKEVAERITSEKETQLSLFVKDRANVFAGPLVKKDEFTPPPKVDSKIVVMEPHPRQVDDEVFELIKQGFAMPRKKLIHNLAKLTDEIKLKQLFFELGIDKDVRPGDLNLDDWKKLRVLMSSLKS